MAAQKCPKCERANGLRAKFCQGCGAPLAGDSDGPEAPGLLDDRAIDTLDGGETEGGSTHAADDGESIETPGAGREDRITPTAVDGTDEPPRPTFASGCVLEVLDGDLAVYRKPVVPGNPVTVGANADRNLVITSDPWLSGKHCRVQVDAGDALVEDTESTNGTFVDKAASGIRVRAEGSTRLDPGDVLVLGKTRVRVVTASEG